MVVVKDALGEWIEVSDQEEMEQACLEENQTHFSQSTQAQTLFTTHLLLEDFRYLAIRHVAKKVLAYDVPPGMDPHAKSFLQLLKMEDLS